MVAAPRRGPLGRSRTTFVLLILTSITLITLDFRGDAGVIASARDVVGDVVDPVRRLASVVTDPVADAWNGATGYDELETENRELRAELASLRGRELAVADAERRLAELEALLGLDAELGIETVTARVVDAPVNNFDRTVQLDVGSDDGVAVDMPVVAPDGLVGRVAAVAEQTSAVELLIDPAFSVGVRLARSGESGVANGVGNRAPLSVDFIDVSTAIVPGETVLTSGLEGSAFPADIVVGTVLDAEIDPIEQTVDLRVVPSVDLNRLDNVQVLLYEPPLEQLPFSPGTDLGVR